MSIQAAFDWLAEWPDQGQERAGDVDLWPWLLFEERLRTALTVIVDKAYRRELEEITKAAATLGGGSVGELVRGISKMQKKLIAAVLEDGLSSGRDWRDTAEQLRLVVGPTPGEAAAIASRYWDRVEEYRAAGYKLNTARQKASRLGKRERARAVARRAVVIARTETTRAGVAARRDAWAKWEADGLLSKDATVEWLVRDPCPQCVVLTGASVPYGTMFPDGDPPLHPNCRCTVVLTSGGPL